VPDVRSVRESCALGRADTDKSMHVGLRQQVDGSFPPAALLLA
jgi:hypothetical protein